MNQTVEVQEEVQPTGSTHLPSEDGELGRAEHGSSSTPAIRHAEQDALRKESPKGELNPAQLTEWNGHLQVADRRHDCGLKPAGMEPQARDSLNAVSEAITNPLLVEQVWVTLTDCIGIGVDITEVDRIARKIKATDQEQLVSAVLDCLNG